MQSYYRIDVEDRFELVGRDVVYVASTEEDAQFLELVRVGCALAAYGARRRIFVIPFMGYSTMERQVRARVCARVGLCSVCVCVCMCCVCESVCVCVLSCVCERPRAHVCEFMPVCVPLRKPVHARTFALG